MKKKRFLIFLIFISLSSIGSAEEMRYVIGRDDVFLRPSTSEKDAFLERLPYGTEVALLSEGDVWTCVEYYGIIGYCKTKFLAKSDPFSIEPHPESIKQAFGTKYLRYGNTYYDFRVMNLQKCLVEGGYLSDDPGADGFFGSATQSAVIRYQKRHGLETNGCVGDDVKRRLWSEYEDLLELTGYIR